MTNLQELIRAGMTEEQKYDVLVSLALDAGQGRLLASPEEILVDKDLRLTLPRCPENLACCPPEYALPVLNDAVPVTGPAQSAYMLGILCYAVFCGEDYFKKTGLRPLELERLPGGRTTVISPEDVSALPFGGAVVQLTDLDPGRRAGGMRALLQFFAERLPGTAVLSYREEGRELRRTERSLRGDIDDLHPSGRIRIDGTDYLIRHGPVAIPYRPGKHVYPIEVRKADGSSAPAEPVSAGTSGGVTAPAGGEPFGQAAITGRWLYGPRALLPDAPGGGEPFVRVLSLNRRDAVCELDAGKLGAGGEFPVVSAASGKKPLVVGRLRLGPTKGAETVRFVYRAHADAVEVRLLDRNGVCVGSRTLALKEASE